ncbi:unnamed protein product [Trichobilharzia szidati]|nr:unnamed protein product [Trichobilharzia szidati]
MSRNNTKNHRFVQYMTPNLLMKKTKSEEPVRVFAVNLSGKNSDYKIEIIENLEQFSELKQLNLSYNRIYKINGLSSLCHLTSLNISHNSIKSLDGIQSLSNLLVLKANDNQITSIPKWLCKRLPKLKTIHLHCNRIDSLHQITYMRSLSNLTVFTFEGNPAVDQLIVSAYNSCSSGDEAVLKNAIDKFDPNSVYRIFVIFHLNSLILLDNKEVLPFERQVAEQRFSQVEVSRYLEKLDKCENRLNEVENKKSSLEKDLLNHQSKLNEALQKRNLESELISHLEEELRAKDKLLHSKSQELARACLKHFELEQELAFHKIDEKLSLADLCLPKQNNSSNIYQIQDTGDQPYLGKCMFSHKPINRSSISHLTSKQSSEDFSTSIKQHRYSLDQLVQNKMHPSIDYNNVCVPQDDDLKSNKPKNENITLLSSTHAISPVKVKQECGNESTYNEANHNQLIRPNSAPDRSVVIPSPVNAFHSDKLHKFSTADKSVNNEKSSELLMKKKENVELIAGEGGKSEGDKVEVKEIKKSSSQTKDKPSSYEPFNKYLDIKQVQLALSKLQSELTELRIKEANMSKDDDDDDNIINKDNSVDPSDTHNSNRIELNNRVQLLENELSKMWRMTSLLKSQPNDIGSDGQNTITNICLNSFVTFPRAFSKEMKQNSPHRQRERSFSLPNKDIDLKQIVSGNNFTHGNGTTSAGSEFGSCEEFVDSPRRLDHSQRKTNHHQSRLSRDNTQRSITPSTPSSRTTGTGRSALLSMLTPRTNDTNDLNKSLPSGNEWNTVTQSNGNPFNEIREPMNSCLPCGSSTPVVMHNVKAKIPNMLNFPRGTGVGGAVPPPPPPPATTTGLPSSTTQPLFDSFHSNSFIENINEDVVDRNFIQQTNSNNPQSENLHRRKLSNSRKHHISRLPKPTPSRRLSHGSDAVHSSDQMYTTHHRKSKTSVSKCRSRQDYSLVRSLFNSKGARRKHKLPRSRSGSHKSEQTVTDSNYSSQNHSLSDHAEELLNLIVMSRDACSVEVNRIRADLARLRKANSRGIDRLGQSKSNTTENVYADRLRQMRNHTDSLKTRYSPAGDDNNDCTYTEIQQPTNYKIQSQRTNYYQQNLIENNHEKNFSPNRIQSKRQTRRLLPHTKSFDDGDDYDVDDVDNDYNELKINDNHIDNNNNSNNDNNGYIDGDVYDEQMNYPYRCGGDYKREYEQIDPVEHWSNGVIESNWNTEHKTSSNRRTTSQHRNLLTGRRPRTRSIPRHPPVSTNYSPCRRLNYERRCSRGHSLDYTRLYPKRPLVRNSATSLLNNLEYHDSDPTSETAALIHLTDELLGLRQGLKRTREANSERLEVALRHISLLELELQRQRCLNHDAELARQHEIERSRWEKRLAATLGELRYCQTNIGKLREQVDQLEASRKLSDQSEQKLERQQMELDQTKATLDAQKEAIITLNNLLNSLLGLNPNDVSPSDLERLQVGLLDLQKRMQPDSSNQYSNQHQQQVPIAFPRQTLHRAQSLMTGLTAPGNEHINRVDWLNPPNVIPTPVIQSTGVNHQLYCNVPEHHDLEDCLGQLQYRIEELSGQQDSTQNKLRHGMKIRKKLETQLEEQDSVLGRLKSELLSCQEDLKAAKQEVTRLSSEKEAAQKSKQENLTSMVADLATLEATVNQRRTELSTLESNIQDSDQQLSMLKAQAKETVSKYEETKREYDTLKSQLDMIRSEKSLADENLEQLRIKLSKTNLQVEQLESDKSSLEKQLIQLEDAVNTKKLEYNQLLPNLSELETRLTRTQHDIQIGAERIRSDHQLRLEDEKLSAIRQAELTRLARQSSTGAPYSQIEEDKLRLEVIAQETETKKTELEVIKAEKRRELENCNSNVRELANQTANKQRELNETQASLNASLDEKERILQSVKALRLERDNIRMELEREQKSVSELTALVTRQKREYEHLTEMSHLEESRLLNLSSQQRDLINQLEKLQTQLNEENEELREREVAKIKKNTEYENVRKDVVREQADLEHIRKEKEQVELELTHLRHERDITVSQWNSFQSKVKELEVQQTLLKDSIAESQLMLARIKAESEAASEELCQKNIERNAALADCDRIFKQTTDSRDEFNIAQQRLQKANELKQSIESSLNEQRRQRVLLSDELSHLEEAVHAGRLAKQLADENKLASEDSLRNVMNKLNKIQNEKKIIEEELNNLRISKDSEQCRLDERLRNTRQHLESVELELSKKSSKLNEVNERLNILQNELNSKELAKSKYEEMEKELEELKRQQQEQQKSPTGNHNVNKQISHNHRYNDLDLNSSLKLQDNNNLLQVLMDTKSALIAAQRESKRLKRRTAREVAELERVAEEQCNRAGDLTEQLSLARRQYAQLKSQITTYGILMDEVITIASQTELTEHGKRLEAALSAVRAELEQHNVVNTLIDESGGSASTIFGQRINEVLNAEPDSRISQDRLLSDARIQEISGHNYPSNGIEKSLLLLTNSFHELNHSPSNLHSIQSLNDSLNGSSSYKKLNHFSPIVYSNNDAGPMDEPGTNYTTSGLGSSLNPGTQADSNGSAQENSAILSPSTPVSTKPIGNEWKQKVGIPAGRQRSHIDSESPITSGSVHQSHTPRHSKSGRIRSRPN